MAAISSGTEVQRRSARSCGSSVWSSTTTASGSSRMMSAGASSTCAPLGPLGPAAEVPALLVAERVDGEQGEGFDEEKRLPEEPQGHEREELIKAAIEDLVERNSSKDFNAGGVPKPVAIKAIVGFQPEADETKKAWLAYQAAKSE